MLNDNAPDITRFTGVRPGDSLNLIESAPRHISAPNLGLDRNEASVGLIDLEGFFARHSRRSPDERRLDVPFVDHFERGSKWCELFDSYGSAAEMSQAFAAIQNGESTCTCFEERGPKALVVHAKKVDRVNLRGRRRAIRSLRIQVSTVKLAVIRMDRATSSRRGSPRGERGGPLPTTVLSRSPGFGFLVGILCLVTSEVTRGADALPSPERVHVEPAIIRLAGKSSRQQITVTGDFSKGEIRDLTAEIRWIPESSDHVTVTSEAVAVPLRNGQGRLRLEVRGQSAYVPYEVSEVERTRPISFRLEVAPVLSKAGCNMGACHGNLNGKGGFRLSLRGEDPGFDFNAITRDSFGRRVEREVPEKSLLILKPTGVIPHEGGIRFAKGSPEEGTLRKWIAEGAVDDLARAPRIIKIEVSPVERVAAAPARTQQLIVTARFSDGSERDVTRQASYDVDDPSVASVSPDGRVEVSRPVETTVAVRYLSARGISRLAFVADRPDFAWNPPATNNVVDRHVFHKLKTLRIQPSPKVDDTIFLRRAYLDAVGRLPGTEESRAFLADVAPQKRDKLIDRILRLPEFADFWALKWADLLRNEEKTMGVKGAWIFQRWLRDALDKELPLDEFVRQILTAKGSTWSNPAASFYRTNRDAMIAAETVGQVFLGVRLQCARCHNHPFDVWTQDDYYGLSAYFANVARKSVNNVRRDHLDKHEINGDEMIFLAGRPQMLQPRSGVMLSPKPPNGPKVELGADLDARDELASWLTRESSQFRRNLANRVWFHLMGRGIVEPVDDFRDSNPPSNPPLLDAITSEFVSQGMRLRPLVALIMKSQTYQTSAVPNNTNRGDEVNFARAAVRLLPAEVLLDAMDHALGKPRSYAKAPAGLHAVQLPGVSTDELFLKTFGKPERLLTCECERSESTTLAQAFQLINGDGFRKGLEADDNRIGKLLERGASDQEILEDVYLAALCRRPSEQEQAKILGHVARSREGRRKAWEDAFWAILSSKEFLLRH